MATETAETSEIEIPGSMEAGPGNTTAPAAGYSTEDAAPTVAASANADSAVTAPGIATPAIGALGVDDPAVASGVGAPAVADTTVAPEAAAPADESSANLEVINTRVPAVTQKDEQVPALALRASPASPTFAASRPSLTVPASPMSLASPAPPASLDLGNATVPVAVTQKDWMSATVATLDHAKDRAKQVQAAVKALEQQEAARLAARKARRRVEALEAAAIEKKHQEALELEHEKRYKEVKAEELQVQQDALRHAKKAESAALRNATASFNEKRRAEGGAKEKERVMTAMKDASQHILSGVLECQHVISKLWGVMMLCDKRRRLRTGRPQTELFKDLVDQALSREWQMLTTSRENLNVLATSGEAFRSEMEMLRVQLNTEQSREKSIRRLMKTSSLPVLASGQLQATSAQAEVTLQQEQKDAIKRALELMDEAEGLPRQIVAAISWVNSQCDLTVTEVHASLDRRKSELGELIRKLQEQKADAGNTMGDAEKRIVRLRRRAQNTMETPRSSKATDDQISAAESLLVDLRSLRYSLENDLRNKCQALKIDDSCRQLTKVKSGGHVTKGCQTKSSMRKTAMEGPFVRKIARDGSFSQLPAVAA